ncbi:MAG: hypothetical protein KAH84_06780 [Thiomargarita sp.]|nr:hypothetical protein [Thiomargarita sp.]
MYKQLFLKQRCFQKRNEAITPTAGTKGRYEWVIARSLCYYQHFSLKDIPSSRQDNVLDLKVKQLSPFKEYASYSIWQGEQVQVWIWDANKQYTVTTEAGIKTATCIPETVLYSQVETNTVQLIQCIEGVEGQIWQNGILVGSRWWLEQPTAIEWNFFQRNHSVATPENLPIKLLKQDLLTRPWKNTKRQFKQLQLQEKTWLKLASILFVAIFTWQIVAIWKLKWTTSVVLEQIEPLHDRVAPILAARTQAINNQTKINQLINFEPYPAQLDIIAKVAEKLPKRNTFITKWIYQLDTLNFVIETKNTDTVFYIETFQSDPLFEEVTAKKGIGRKSNQITMDMKLVSELINN